MLCRTLFRRVTPTMPRVVQYIDHLHVKEGKELLPLSDIMPSAGDGLPVALEFQKLLIEHLCKERPQQHQHDKNNSNTVKQQRILGGWTCTLPGDALLRNMGHHDPAIFCPLPAWQVSSSSSSSSPSSSLLSKKRQRVQSVEMTLAVQMEPRSMQSTNPVIKRVAPAILVRGSRYPFYAPHAAGFAADLGAAVHLAVGGGQMQQSGATSGEEDSAGPVGMEYASLPLDLKGHGTVLTLGIEPVAVGYIDSFHLEAASSVVQHVFSKFQEPLIKGGVLERSRDRTTSSSRNGDDDGDAADDVRDQQDGGGDVLVAGAEPSHWWFTTGCLARVPASVGTYKANFGVLGSATVTIAE